MTQGKNMEFAAFVVLQAIFYGADNVVMKVAYGEISPLWCQTLRFGLAFALFMILFGKRKFAVTLLLGIFLKLVVELLFPVFPFATVAFRGVGAITPSLLANTYSRQSILYTIPATLAATLVTYGLVTLLSTVLAG